MKREQNRSYMKMDNKLKLALGFNIVVLLLILIVPNLPERHMFEIKIEPEIVRLGTEFSVEIVFEDIPTSCVLKIVDVATERMIESREFSSVNGKSIVANLFADEEKYPIGLQIARVEAIYGGKKVVREAYFPVSTGYNISAMIRVDPPILRLKPGENATVSVSIEVFDELNRSVSNAMVWVWTDVTNASLTPNLSKTDVNGKTSAILYLPPGNFTQVKLYVTVAKRGHPAFSTSLDIPVMRGG
jgi:hypothetical protein